MYDMMEYSSTLLVVLVVPGTTHKNMHKSKKCSAVLVESEYKSISQLSSLMMLRELTSAVGGLLVSVNSVQLCFVCGDGYQVGNPSAIGSFPEFPDTLVTCEDIELAGLQGLIPTKQCLALPISIFETCNCQANTTESTQEHANAFRESGSSSLRRAQSWSAESRRPIAAPFLSGSAPPVATSAVTPSYSVYSTNPVAASPYFPDMPVAGPFYPRGGSRTSAPAYVIKEDAPGFPWAAVLVPLAVCCMFFIFIRTYIPVPADSRQILATPRRLPTTNPTHPVPPRTRPMHSVLPQTRLAQSIGTIGRESDEDANRRRVLVLEVLFPNEGEVSTAYLYMGLSIYLSSRIEFNI
jgi:hypothetical protein